MKEATVKITLSEESSILQRWEQPFQTNMPEVFETVKQMKQSINDYLTLLISQRKNIHAQGQTELTEYSDMEEECENDSISGFIQDMVVVSEKPSTNEKRKINYLSQAKKIKK